MPKDTRTPIVHVAGDAIVSSRRLLHGNPSSDFHDIAGNSLVTESQHTAEVYALERFLESTRTFSFPRVYDLHGSTSTRDFTYSLHPKPANPPMAVQVNGPSTYDSDYLGPAHSVTRSRNLAKDSYLLGGVKQPLLGGVETIRCLGSSNFAPPTLGTEILAPPVDSVQASDVVVAALGAGSAFRTSSLTASEGRLKKHLSGSQKSLILKLRYRCYGDLGGKSEQEQALSFFKNIAEAFDEYKKEDPEAEYFPSSVLVLNVNDLRRANIVVSEGLSWERTVEEFVSRTISLTAADADADNMDHRWIPYLSIRFFNYIVCTFHLSGVCAINRTNPKKPTVALFVSPSEIEGDFESRYPGRMRASEVIMATSLGYHAIHAEKVTWDTIKTASRSGLTAARFGFARGMTPLRQSAHLTAKEAKQASIEVSQNRNTLANLVPELSRDLEIHQDHPYDPIGQVIRMSAHPGQFLMEDVFWINGVENDPQGKGRHQLGHLSYPVKLAWEAADTVVELEVDTDWFFKSSDEGFKNVGQLNWSFFVKGEHSTVQVEKSEEYKIANAILDGKVDLKTGHITGTDPRPVSVFGKLVSFSRAECEQLRELARDVRAYIENPDIRHAHNIVLLGEPGSGKSFSVKEVLNSLNLSRLDTDFIPVNLSGIESRDQLISSLHQARNKSIKGKIPTVFFDEFDCWRDKEFGWLRQFLAPMWDMEFRQDGSNFLGPSLLVFAGSRFTSIADFITAATAHIDPDTRHTTLDSLSDPDKVRNADFSANKGVDFASRFTTPVDILGVNPTRDDDPSNAYKVKPAQHAHVVKRALILRSNLLRYPALWSKGAVNIQPQVRRAFLLTRRYHHGARSLEQIVLASPLAQRSTYDSVALPSEWMLRLHVDVEDFLDYIEGKRP